MDFVAHPLWDFTVQAHQRSGVHEACMKLQVSYKIDINFLFWCCWLAERGVPPLDVQQMQNAVDTVGQWQREIVRPIWKARWKLKHSYGRFSKTSTEALRRQLVNAELDAEHIEMLHLAQSVSIKTDRTVSKSEKISNAVKNLRLYLLRHFAGNDPKSRQKIPEDLLEPLSLVLKACFPEMKREEGGRVLRENLRE